MNDDQLAQRFCAIVNEALSTSAGQVHDVIASFGATLTDTEEFVHFNKLRVAYQNAENPSDFSNLRIIDPDIRLDQCYELLSLALGPEVLDPKESFASAISASRLPINPYVMIGRFWSVPGSQVYDPEGRLVHFNLDPLTITSSIAAAITGNYLPIDNHLGQGIGGIGQAATREGMRGKGHGKQVLDAFEAQIRSVAQLRGEKLHLMILEAEGEARNFWASCGYRWPLGSQYFQPPIDYDKDTGKALYPAVPELLMVKLLDEPDANQIDRLLLIDAVHTLYNNWYIPNGLSESVTAAITTHVFDGLFKGFLDSLQPEGVAIPLVLPPVP